MFTKITSAPAEGGDLPEGRFLLRPALLHDELYQLGTMPEDERLDIVLAGRCISIERFPADCTIFSRRRHDHVAVGTDMGLEGGLLLLLLLGIVKAIDPPQLPLDVLPG